MYQHNHPFLTYLVDKDDFIYCSRGIGFHTERVVVSLIYFPDAKGDRIRDGRHYGKTYVDCGIDLNNLEKLPELARTKIKKLVRQEGLGVSYLSLPLCEIKETILPFSFNGHSPKSEIGELFRSFLVESGIPEEAVGIYGGRAIGIEKTVADDYSDVDIAVSGLEYLNKLRTISAEDLNYYGIKRIPRKATYDMYAKAQNIRDQMLGFIFDQTKIDVKFVRDKGDLFTFFSIGETESYRREGIVVSDIEAPTLPACYQIETKGGLLTVQTLLFHFIGSAWNGDRVKVVGEKLVGKDAVVLRNQDHYILRR